MSGRVLLPIGRIAREPYRVALIDRNVYSAEELCCTIGQCASFLDDRLRDEGLLRWLDEELGLRDLARQLRPLLKNKGGLADFAGVILLYTGYHTQPQIDRILQKIRESHGMEPFERQVAEARFSAGSGRIGQAQEQLDTVLENLPAPEKELRARIWKEKGVLYTDIFRFENAAVCFGKAWKLVQNPQYGRFYLTCLKLTVAPEELQAFLAQNRDLQALMQHVDADLEEAEHIYAAGPRGRQVRRMAKALQDGRQKSFDRLLEEHVKQLKDTYRQSRAGID